MKEQGAGAYVSTPSETWQDMARDIPRDILRKDVPLPQAFSKNSKGLG